jgi:putative nucleotidyltransferase with HDIG domain
MALQETAGSRRGWDAPARSPAQERFYRELMAAESLPSAPEIAQRVLVAVNREDARLDALSKLIVRDQALAARLLRLANSAFYALPARVTSIPHAVTLLGFDRVRDIVLGLSVWNVLDSRDPAGHRFRRSLWTHSATVAAAAKMLAEQTGGDAGAAFAAGLMHDIGKLVLGLRLGGTYWAMLDDAVQRGVSAAEAESEALGCHHATVGGWLLQLWQLPPTLVDPVAMHHDPLVTAHGMDVVAAVAVADRLVNATDPKSGTAHDAALAEIQAFAPGLHEADAWREQYARLVREQHAISGIFDRKVV